MHITSFELGSMGANCYVVIDDEAKSCAVIDPGGQGHDLARWLEGEGLTPKAVFLTHGHFDHVGGVKALLEHYADLPVYVHAADTDLGPHLGKGLVFNRHYDEGDVMEIDGLTFRILNTPGHTPGSVCIRLEDSLHLFTGDTLFAGSCGRTDFPKGSWTQMQQSLARLAAMEENLHVLSGHGPASTLDRERNSNPYMKEALQ